MALSYIVGTSLFAFLGGISFKYMNQPTNNTINVDNINDSICYSLLDNNLRELDVSSIKSESLGNTSAQKSYNIKKLLKDRCGINIVVNRTKKSKQKIQQYIKDYERLGIDQFVKKYKKSHVKV